MSQHDKRTQHGPGLGLISSYGVAAGAALAAGYWIMGSGETFDGRHLAGTVLGIVLFAVCGTRAFLLADERAVKREARRRRMQLAAAEAEGEVTPRRVFRPWVAAPEGLPRFLSEEERAVWYRAHEDATAVIERVTA